MTEPLGGREQPRVRTSSASKMFRLGRAQGCNMTARAIRFGTRAAGPGPGPRRTDMGRRSSATESASGRKGEVVAFEDGATRTPAPFRQWELYASLQHARVAGAEVSHGWARKIPGPGAPAWPPICSSIRGKNVRVGAGPVLHTQRSGKTAGVDHQECAMAAIQQTWPERANGEPRPGKTPLLRPAKPEPGRSMINIVETVGGGPRDRGSGDVVNTGRGPDDCGGRHRLPMIVEGQNYGGVGGGLDRGPTADGPVCNS